MDSTGNFDRYTVPFLTEKQNVRTPVLRDRVAVSEIYETKD